MKRFRKGALAALAILAVAVAAYVAFTRFASPESVARADSYRVWIALLKGLEGDVYYVGNDSTHAYFRIGRVFWSYFKVPACAARPPQAFSVGSAKPYVVRLHIQSDNNIRIGKSCSGEQEYELGQLDRA
jgi:hypothetical protein